MMKRLLLLFIVFASEGVAAQEYVIWKGRVVDLDSQTPVVGVHFRSSRQQGISDHLGYFEIAVKKGELVTVSHIAYRSIEYTVLTDALPRLLFLSPGEQELGEVTVSSMPSEAEFKQILISSPYIPSQMEVHLRQNLSYMLTIHRLNNNHVLNSIDHMRQKISKGNGEVNLFSFNPSLGIMGVIRSLKKPGAIPFDKPRDFHYVPIFRAAGDTTLNFKKYFD